MPKIDTAALRHSNLRCYRSVLPKKMAQTATIEPTKKAEEVLEVGVTPR